MYRGLGLTLSKRLLESGSTVIMTCRSEVKCAIEAGKIKETIQNVTIMFESSSTKSLTHTEPKLYLFPLDMEDLDSIKLFTDTISSKFNRLDYLINNAGYRASEGGKYIN